MGQQLTIPTFKQPIHITLEDVLIRMNSKEVIYEEPSKKEIRLAIDLAKQLSPLFEFKIEEQLETIKKICKYDILEDKILNVKSFKQILFKEVITNVKPIGNGKYKVELKRVRRR